jgi:hypothetical protein
VGVWGCGGVGVGAVWGCGDTHYVRHSPDFVATLDTYDFYVFPTQDIIPLFYRQSKSLCPKK